MNFLHYLLLAILVTTFEEITAVQNGWTAIFPKYNYLASIWHNDGKATGHICTGAIITVRYILTAAHCPRGKVQNDLIVHAGIHDITGLLPDINRGSLSSTFAVERSSVGHVIDTFYAPGSAPPDGEHGFTHGVNDMAILKLREPLRLGLLIQPVRRTKVPLNYDDTRCIFCGWGLPGDNDPKIDYDSGAELNAVTPFRRPFPSPLLRCIYMKVATKDNCLGGHRDNEFCGKPEKSTASSTPGDSGGPLVCNNKVVGVMSTGDGPSSTIFVDLYKQREFVDDVVLNNR